MIDLSKNLDAPSLMSLLSLAAGHGAHGHASSVRGGAGKRKPPAAPAAQRRPSGLFSDASETDLKGGEASGGQMAEVRSPPRHACLGSLVHHARSLSRCLTLSSLSSPSMPLSPPAEGSQSWAPKTAAVESQQLRIWLVSQTQAALPLPALPRGSA